MDFRNNYPDFATIEAHIRAARAERAVVVASLLAGAVVAIGGGIRKLIAALGDGLQAHQERRMIEADSFLKRWVPKY